MSRTGVGGLPGAEDADARVESGRTYETHGWFNLAQSQYLEAIRLAPDRPGGYEALAAYLGRIQAWPAAWLIVSRARRQAVPLDPALLRALDERSGWPISSSEPVDPPAAAVQEVESLLPRLTGIAVAASDLRPELRDRINSADEATDRLIPLGYLCGSRLRRALAAERGDPYLRASLCNVLLRVELGRRAVGEAPDSDLVREVAAALLTLDRAELWFPLWSAATVLARLEDAAGLPVFDRVLAIDGTRLSGAFQSPRLEWDLLLVFALGPLGERVNDVLEPALRQPDPVRRSNALRTLAVLFHDGLLPCVRAAAAEECAPEYRLMIALFHLQFRHPDTLRELRKVLEHGLAGEPQRMAAVEALGELGSGEAREILRTLAEGGDTPVHRHARQVLLDLDAGRFEPAESSGSRMTPEQADQALDEMIGEYGVGLSRLSGSFLESCDRSHLPRLYRLRARILWRVTRAALEDLKAANEVIRKVLRGR